MWEAVASLATLTDEAGASWDELWECLFEPTNSSLQFNPVAPGRGVPADASTQVLRDWESQSEPHTVASWIDWAGIERIDLQELSPGFDRGPARYRRVVAPDGRLGGWTPDGHEDGYPGLQDFHPLEEERDGFLYRWERRTRGQVLSRYRERPLLETLRESGEIHGPGNARMIFWMWS